MKNPLTSSPKLGKHIILAIIFILLTSNSLLSEKIYSPSAITKVAFLGTGTPNPDPNHSGISVAIVVNDIPYLVDFGPGLIRQAAALSPRYGGKIKGLAVENLKIAFLTHLHSDHTTGFADLIFTPWIEGRNEPLQVYGPEGIKSMSKHLLEAYKEDIRVRIYGSQPVNNIGWRIKAHEIREDRVIPHPAPA